MMGHTLHVTAATPSHTLHVTAATPSEHSQTSEDGDAQSQQFLSVLSKSCPF